MVRELFAMGEVDGLVPFNEALTSARHYSDPIHPSYEASARRRSSFAGRHDSREGQ